LARDYYEVLGVERDADDKALKRAYRKLAMDFHPDRNPDDPHAEEKFKEISEAYEVLSNGEKRRIYDQFGHDGLRGRGFEPNFTDMGDIYSHFSDIFSSLFGGGFGGFGGGGARRGPRRGADLEVLVELDFLEAALGVKRDLEVPRRVHCATCTGSGLKPGAKPVTCAMCGGRGQIVQRQGMFQLATTCPSCRGQGQTTKAEDRCPDCGGSGRLRETETLSVTIPAGIDTGQQLRLVGKGEAGDPGAPPGNLFVTVKVRPHEVFQRDGSETYCKIDVPFPTMVLGGDIRVPTVHGEESLRVPAGTESGKVFVLRGKGLEQPASRGPRGDHHVQAVVAVPKRVSAEEEELIRKLASLGDVGIAEKGFWQGLFERLGGA
jgi:molecular chaperone DnaJ